MKPYDFLGITPASRVAYFAVMSMTIEASFEHGHGSLVSTLSGMALPKTRSSPDDMRRASLLLPLPLDVLPLLICPLYLGGGGIGGKGLRGKILNPSPLAWSFSVDVQRFRVIVPERDGSGTIENGHGNAL